MHSHKRRNECTTHTLCPGKGKTKVLSAAKARQRCRKGKKSTKGAACFLTAGGSPIKPAERPQQTSPSLGRKRTRGRRAQSRVPAPNLLDMRKQERHGRRSCAMAELVDNRKHRIKVRRRLRRSGPSHCKLAERASHICACASSDVASCGKKRSAEVPASCQADATSCDWRSPPSRTQFGTLPGLRVVHQADAHHQLGRQFRSDPHTTCAQHRLGPLGAPPPRAPQKCTECEAAPRCPSRTQKRAGAAFDATPPLPGARPSPYNARALSAHRPDTSTTGQGGVARVPRGFDFGHKWRHVPIFASPTALKSQSRQPDSRAARPPSPDSWRAGAHSTRWPYKGLWSILVRCISCT